MLLASLNRASLDLERNGLCTRLLCRLKFVSPASQLKWGAVPFVHHFDERYC